MKKCSITQAKGKASGEWIKISSASDMQKRMMFKKKLLLYWWQGRWGLIALVKLTKIISDRWSMKQATNALLSEPGRSKKEALITNSPSEFCSLIYI